MKLIARHLTADLFGCKNKKITDIDLIKQELSGLLAAEQYEVISLSTYSLRRAEAGAFHHAYIYGAALRRSRYIPLRA